MRILVAGAGAVGGFLAARLAEAGQDVTVLARSRRAGQLRDGGLRLAAADGTRTLRPPVLTAAELAAAELAAAELAAGPGAPRPGGGGPGADAATAGAGRGYDAVLVAVKADALDQVMKDIAPAVGPGTAIVPFLNGMAHLDALAGVFGTAVLGGVLRVMTDLDGDGTIRVLAPLFEVELGELDGSRSDRADRLAAAFRTAGADVAVRTDIVGAMWAKWVFIASIGAVTSLMRAPVGDIVAVAGGEDFARSVLAEAAGAAAAAGHPVPPAQLAATMRTLTAAGAPTTSSLSRDLMAGRPTEVEAVLADFAGRAAAAGAGTPLIALSALALRVHNRRLAPAVQAP
jgi:2-dehydropantoate 2-reductase